MTTAVIRLSLAQRQALTLLLILGLLIMGLAALKAQRLLWSNLSASAPMGIWFRQAGPAAPGDWVIICLPDAPAQLALQRGYLNTGSCPNHVEPVLKRMVGMGGDRVRIDAAGITINGLRQPHSKPQLTDGHGRALPKLTIERALQADEYVLMTPASGSYDSRYFGPVSGVVARVRPVLTWD